MKENPFLLVLAYAFVALVFMICLTWLFNIFAARPFREAFGDFNEGCQQETSKDTQTVLDTSIGLQRPFVTNEMSRGDNEAEFAGGMNDTYLNKFEGGIQAQKDAINLARRQFPFDWANAPPSAKIFQEQNALFLDKDNLLRNAGELDNVYNKMDTNTAALLPKESFVDIPIEDKTLRSYAPCKSQEVGKVSKEDAIGFIEEYYDSKGLIPEIVQKGEVYQVVSTSKKDPKIMYEDEVKATDDVFKPMSTNSEFDVAVQRKGNWDDGIGSTSAILQKNEPSQPLERIFGPGLQYQQY
jgi:hypothetical protein